MSTENLASRLAFPDRGLFHDLNTLAAHPAIQPQRQELDAARQTFDAQKIIKVWIEGKQEMYPLHFYVPEQLRQIKDELKKMRYDCTFLSEKPISFWNGISDICEDVRDLTYKEVYAKLEQEINSLLCERSFNLPTILKQLLPSRRVD